MIAITTTSGVPAALGHALARGDDLLEIATDVDGIAQSHQEYLARGGVGFALAMANPGRDRDRGPVNVAGLRLNVRY